MTDKSRRFGNLSPERLPYCEPCGICALTEKVYRVHFLMREENRHEYDSEEGKSENQF